MTARLYTYEDDLADVGTALDLDRGLTDWEVGFVESIGMWVIDDKRALTEKQRQTLHRILDKYLNEHEEWEGDPLMNGKD